MVDIPFGRAVADPYRWMEQWHGEEVQAWLRAQAAYSRAYLDALPVRQRLRGQIAALGDALPKISGLFLAGERCFYLRRDPDASQARLVVRRRPDDPNKLWLTQRFTTAPPRSIGGPSWDGAYVAYGISTYGSEDSTLYVVEVDSARMLDLAISRTQFGDVYWLPDNRAFVYRQFPARSTQAPPPSTTTIARSCCTV